MTHFTSGNSDGYAKVNSEESSVWEKFEQNILNV